jgi:hypothetical protein
MLESGRTAASIPSHCSPDHPAVAGRMSRPADKQIIVTRRTRLRRFWRQNAACQLNS